MDTLKKIFPFAFKYVGNVKNLVIGILIHLLVGIVAGVVIAVAGILTDIPVLGDILALALRIIGSIVDLYVVAGIVIELLVHFKVIK